MHTTHQSSLLAITLVAALFSTGCPFDADEIEDILDELDDIEFVIDREVEVLQRDVFVDPQPLRDRGDTIIINNNVTVINDVREDIIIEELPDLVLLGFENNTIDDAFYVYRVDGVRQSIFVFSGETLLLEYPCPFEVELVSEEYFDPFTGVSVAEFDTFAIFEEPFDYQCGDALIISFFSDGVDFEATPLELLN